MNLIKRRRIYYLCTIFLGLLLVGISFFANTDNVYIIGLGCGLCGGSGAKLIQLRKIASDPESARRFNTRQSEERAVFLANKSGNIMYLLVNLAEFTAIVVFMFMGNSKIINILSLAVFVQLFVRAGIMWYLNKKY
ncbi:MAG: hypothetical protein RSB78_01555 [Oscillospiraceae bacterium]